MEPRIRFGGAGSVRFQYLECEGGGQVGSIDPSPTGAFGARTERARSRVAFAHRESGYFPAAAEVAKHSQPDVRVTSGNRNRPSSPPPASPSPRPWVERVRALSAQLATPLDDRRRAEARGELWLLLCSALAQSIRAQRASIGHLSREDVEDLASNKALDLLRGVEEGRIVFEEDTAERIPAFMARISRNAIIDLLRKERGREGRPSEEEEEELPTSDAPSRASDRADVASSPVEFDELARAIDSCLERLAPRARRIWIFRTLFEMSSREIADHPDIGLRADYVDVLVGRVRNAVRACLAEHGFEGNHENLSGIARLWERLAQRDAREATE